MQTFHHPLSPEEESHYLQKAKAGDLSARNILVEYNLRLVAHIVKKYQTGNRSTEDLISIGTIGLIKRSIHMIPTKVQSLSPTPVAVSKMNF